MADVEAVIEALTESLEGDGDDLCVDLDALADRLVRAGVRCRRFDRNAAARELETVRDELRTYRTRARHGDEDAARVLGVLQARELELTGALWPEEAVLGQV